MRIFPCGLDWPLMVVPWARIGRSSELQVHPADCNSQERSGLFSPFLTT